MKVKNGKRENSFPQLLTRTQFGLINASGRYFMPEVGRFVSADPFIQSPSDLQSLNRYSYVENDPLNSVDPSGFITIRARVKVKWGKAKNWGRDIGRAVKNTGRAIAKAGQQWIDVHRNIYNEGDRFADKYGKQIVIIAAAAAITVASGGSLSGLGASMVYGALTIVAINAAVITYNGGNFQDIMNSSMNAAVNGAASAAALHGTNSALNSGLGKEFTFGSGKHLARTGTHAVVNGTVTEANGGNFKDGMISASITQALSPLVVQQFGNSTDAPQYKFHRIASSGAIGGTAAYASGGNIFMGVGSGIKSGWESETTPSTQSAGKRIAGVGNQLRESWDKFNSTFPKTMETIDTLEIDIYNITDFVEILLPPPPPSGLCSDVATNIRCA